MLVTYMFGVVKHLLRDAHLIVAETIINNSIRIMNVS